MRRSGLAALSEKAPCRSETGPGEILAASRTPRGDGLPDFAGPALTAIVCYKMQIAKFLLNQISETDFFKAIDAADTGREQSEFWYSACRIKAKPQLHKFPSLPCPFLPFYRLSKPKPMPPA